MALLAIIQSTVLPKVPILGVVPHILLLATVAWGLRYGLRQGIIWAFIAGLFFDLFSIGPLGASALSLILAVVVIHRVQRSFPESRILMPSLLSGLATLVYWFVYLLLLRLLVPLIVDKLQFLGIAALSGSARAPNLLQDVSAYYTLNHKSWSMILPLVMVHALLILPVFWGLHGLEQIARPRRVEI
jgi:rod shape-determining protein MreD